MANNCLVTKLKGSVDNSNLPIYNSIEFTLLAGRDVQFNLGNNPYNFTITVTGDGDIKSLDKQTSYGKSYTWSNYPATYNGPTLVVANTTDCKVVITNIKYIFDYFTLAPISTGYGAYKINPNQFIYNDNAPRIKHSLLIGGAIFTEPMKLDKVKQYINIFQITNSTTEGGDPWGGDPWMFEGFLNPSVSNMINCGKKGYVNAASLVGRSDITRLNVGLSGDIKYLAETSVPTNATMSVYLHSGAGSDTRNSWTTGTIEGLVNEYIQKGVTSGSLMLEFPNFFRNVTYQGTPLSEHTEIVSTARSLLNWDAQGNITWSVKP